MRHWMIVTVVVALGCGQAPEPQTPPTTPHASAVVLDMSIPGGEAGERLKAAAAQMDAGNSADAVATLEDLHRRLPQSGVVVHELGLAYRLLKQPEKAIALWTPLRPSLAVDTLASLASALDEAGRSGAAQALLRSEIQTHAQSGILYSELATSLLNANRKSDALALYEKSIEVDPPFRASYLHAAEILASTRSRGMALLYGETFRVLEPNSDRSNAVARMMVQVCKDAVTIEGSTPTETKIHMALAPDYVVDASKPTELPVANLFEMAFGPGLAVEHLKGLNLAGLHAVKRGFVEMMKDDRFSKSALGAMPIVRWLRALAAAGHLEAYDYWLYAPAMPDEAVAWLKAHKPAADAMDAWVTSHPLFAK